MGAGWLMPAVKEIATDGRPLSPEGVRAAGLILDGMFSSLPSHERFAPQNLVGRLEHMTRGITGDTPEAKQTRLVIAAGALEESVEAVLQRRRRDYFSELSERLTYDVVENESVFLREGASAEMLCDSVTRAIVEQDGWLNRDTFQTLVEAVASDEDLADPTGLGDLSLIHI